MSKTLVSFFSASSTTKRDTEKLADEMQLNVICYWEKEMK